MAFDQNSMPNNLRPINIVRPLGEESRIMPGTVATNQPWDIGGHPGSVPVYYPTTVPDAGLLGLGFGNGMPTITTNWVPCAPAQAPSPIPVIGTVGVNSTVGHNYNPNCTTRHDPTVASRVSCSASDHVSDEGGDDSVSGKKVKFLCSFGGKILPRPSDGVLRYVGGHTRIVGVRRDVGFEELVQKMANTCRQNVVIKYQLPDEDLDALVSISGPDDLENMMDEYEKLVDRSSDGSAKLRVFLFLASELDSSGVIRFGDFQDSSQRYVEAVNGIVDAVSGGIARKESVASATSTQNSELSGTEAGDNSGHDQAEVAPLSTSGVLSPTGNSAVAHEMASKMVYLDSSPAHVDVSVGTLSIPAVNNVTAAPTVALTAHPDPDLQRPMAVPVAQQYRGYDLQQSGVNYPLPGPYIQAYVDPRGASAEYIQLPSQVGFPGQLLGTVAPVFSQQQFHDNAIGVPPHQFIPAVHMTVAPPTHISLNPNAVPALLKQQQIRLQHYPGDQNYTAYQAQVPGGGCGWIQAPNSEQVGFAESRMPHQQAVITETVPRFEECYMCQKGLPHAHSDTLMQEHKEGSATTSVTDLNSVYHSMRVEDSRGIQMNNVTGMLGEVAVDKKGGVVHPVLLGHIDSKPGKTKFEQNVDGHYTSHTPFPQKAINLDASKVSVPQGAEGFASIVGAPDGVFSGTFPQLFQESVGQRNVMPSQYQVNKRDIAINKLVKLEDPLSGVVLPVSSGQLLQESPNDYSGNLNAEDAAESCFAHNNLKQAEGMRDDLRISPCEVFLYNEKKNFHVDNHFSTPLVVADANFTKQSDVMPCSSGPPILQGFQPVGPYEMDQQSLFDSPTYPHSLAAINHNAISCGNPSFSIAEPSYVSDKVPMAGEWNDTPPLESKFVTNDAAATPSDAISLFNMVAEVTDGSNSLFSSKDHWNLHHDTHFPPPRPNKILIKKEIYSTKDPFGDSHLGNIGESFAEMHVEDGVHQPSSSLDIDFTMERGHSNKGSSEDLIKQELQAIAEGVAASVLWPSMPSNTESNQNQAVQNHSPQVQNNDKFEIKLLENTNFGFPASDSLGRLQIIKDSDLEELKELGSGTFGTVYHGKWRGSDVAIKRINDRCFAGKASEQERMREDFWNEAIKLADLHHPNVVAFYGVVLDGPGGSVATVTEFMVNGSLRNALQKNERNLDKRRRLLIAMDVAFGMEYLHGKNIVHFDLKSDNLLVNLRDPHRPICKVGDLGLSKVKCQTLISGGVRGTLPWMAPELLNGSSSLVSEKVDVFSFGIVMWELLTGDEPYADLHYGTIIGGIVSNTLRPPVPESCDLEWKSLMERCWSAEPLERPSFTEVANQLRSMAAKAPQKVQQTQQ